MPLKLLKLLNSHPVSNTVESEGAQTVGYADTEESGPVIGLVSELHLLPVGVLGATVESRLHYFRKGGEGE